MIYKPEFVFIPHSVNSFFGLLGMMCFLGNKSQRNAIMQRSNANPIPVLKTYMPVLAACFITIIINLSTEMVYVTGFISLVLYFFMAYLGAVGFYKIYGEVTPRILLKYFVAIAVIHVCISLAMFANSSLNDILMSLLKKSQREEDALERTLGSRLQGFGATFYTSGLINGFILIMISVGLYHEKYSVLSKAVLYLSFIIILAIGTMIARTIMVGAALGILIILASVLRSRKELFENMMLFIFTITFAVFVGSYYIVSSGIDFEAISEFGFEYLSKFAEGDTSSHSTDSMLDMYNTIPDNLKTWMFGDGRWQEEGHYYMNVDIGYLRNVFYFGLLGSIFLYIYNFVTLKTVIYRKRLFENYSFLLVLVLFIYTMLINLKGTIDLFYYILPYYFCTTPTKQQSV